MARRTDQWRPYRRAAMLAAERRPTFRRQLHHDLVEFDLDDSKLGDQHRVVLTPILQCPAAGDPVDDRLRPFLVFRTWQP
jgi:hypothetical protein